jgi:hypothetical protein
MEHVIIGVDPHKLSVTIEVADHHEKLGLGRFTTDRAGVAECAALIGAVSCRSVGGERACRRAA